MEQIDPKEKDSVSKAKDNAPEIKFIKKRKDFSYRCDRQQTRVLQCTPNLHQHIEILYLIEGSVTAVMDGHTYELTAGDVFVAFPYHVHNYISKNTTPNENGIIEGGEKFMLLLFNHNTVPSLVETFNKLSPVSPLIHLPKEEMKDIYELLNVISRIGSSRQRPEFTRPEVLEIRKGLLTSLCHYIFKKIDLCENSTAFSPVVRSITNYCITNFHRDIDLDDIAEELHISKYYVSRLFAKKMGIKFVDYVNSMRVSEACRYLRRTQMDIAEIGTLVGFNTQRTFNRVFLKQMGVSPTDYRKTSVGTVDVSLL